MNPGKSNLPSRSPLQQLNWFWLSPFRDAFAPGRKAHRDNIRIGPDSDDVAQAEKVDFGDENSGDMLIDTNPDSPRATHRVIV